MSTLSLCASPAPPAWQATVTRLSTLAVETDAELFVLLHHSQTIENDELWRYAADFKTLAGKKLGVKLTRLPEDTMFAEGSVMSVQKVEMETLSPEVRTFLARAGEGQGVLVEDARSQDRYCVVKFREPTPMELQTALQRMSEIGAAVQETLDQKKMSVQDAESELQQAITEVRREKAGP